MDNLELFALKDFNWLDIKADKLTQYKQFLNHLCDGELQSKKQPAT